jgi:hypothetical protein
MIHAHAAVARNIKSAAENEGNAAKGLPTSNGIFFVSSPHVESVVRLERLKD